MSLSSVDIFNPYSTYNFLVSFCFNVCVCLVTQLCLLCDPVDYSPQAPLSMGILQARILNELPCPPPGDLPNPGIEPRSPSLQADSLLTELLGKP